jgi:phosphoribosylaminoimidazole-succinocarboxamide synthase
MPTLLHRGKVRDVYALDDQRLLLVASDRLSAFDVILPDTIPGKGVVLTQLSNFWFTLLAEAIDNHLLEPAPSAATFAGTAELIGAERRSVVVKRLQGVPIEAVVRGYLAGSALKEYQQVGSVHGLTLPAGLVEADALPQPIFTPTTKAAVGDHDLPLTFDACAARIGSALAEQVRAAALNLFSKASQYAAARGLLLADTKFEFGLDPNGNLVWMDEALTPDSSRFWAADSWQPGRTPEAFDKQYVRDYLLSQNWNKQPPGPQLPASVISATQQRYLACYQKLTGQVLAL